MKQVIAILLIFGTVSLVNAQISSATFLNLNFKDSLEIGTYNNAGLYSNMLDNTFLTKFYQGRYLNKTTKDNTLSNLSDVNSFGGDLTNGVFYSHLIPGGENLNFQLRIITGLEHKEVISGQFTKNAFDLIFNGNAKFAGDTISLAETKLNHLIYQKVFAGISVSRGMGRELAIVVDFIKGQSMSQFILSKGDLFTSNLGDTIAFNSSVMYASSDTAVTGLKSFNGWGLGINIMYKIDFESNELPGFFMMELKDFGFIKWNANSLNTSINSNFYYAGFQFDNLGIKGSGTNIVDSISNTIKTNSKKEAITTTTQANFGMYIFQQQSKELNYTLGINYRINANHLPFLFYRQQYKIDDWIRVSGTAGYGGYGHFWLGFGLQAEIKSFKFSLGTQNILGLVAASKIGGFGGYLTLSKTF